VSAIRYDRLPSGDKSTILRPDLQKKSSYVYNRNHTILQEHLGIRTASDNDAAEISTVYDVDKVLNYTRVVRNGVEKSAAINSRNQITTLGGASLSWDRNGNLTEYAGKRMQYDSGNQLRRIALPGGAVIENLYGPSGRKVRETVSAQSSTRVTEYVWNGPRIAEEYVAGKLAARYVHGRGIDEIVRAEQSTKLDGTLDRTLYPLQDELGNVERLTDGAGATLERYEYEGYGLFTSYRPLASGGEGPATSATSAYGWRHLFQGREYSELSGSYDFRARTLWPDLGRFGQEDPAGVFDHGNLYQSVLGDWTMNSDPSGEVVVMMHGIKDDGAGWASGVAQAFGEQWDQTGADPGQDVINLVNQQWTGPQNVPGCNPGEFCLGNAYWSLMKGHLDRDTRRAGEKVALHMNQLRTILNASKTRIGEPIQVLAHSHGTSMLLAATQTSRKSHPITMTWFRIQKAVMVGSDMKYSTNIGALLSVADAVFNFYSPHDEAVGIAVAPGGGGRGFHEPRDFVRLKMLKAANLTQTELPGIRHTGDVFERQHGSIPWMSRQLAMRYYSGIFEIRARRKVGESQSWLGSYALLRGLMGLRQTMDLSPYFFLSYPSARP